MVIPTFEGWMYLCILFLDTIAWSPPKKLIEMVASSRRLGEMVNWWGLPHPLPGTTHANLYTWPLHIFLVLMLKKAQGWRETYPFLQIFRSVTFPSAQNIDEDKVCCLVKWIGSEATRIRLFPYSGSSQWMTFRETTETVEEKEQCCSLVWACGSWAQQWGSHGRISHHLGW